MHICRPIVCSSSDRSPNNLIMQQTVCSSHVGHFQQKIREHFFSYCNILFIKSRNAYLEAFCIQLWWWVTRLSNHATNSLLPSRRSFPKKIREHVFWYF